MKQENEEKNCFCFTQLPLNSLGIFLFHFVHSHLHLSTIENKHWKCELWVSFTEFIECIKIPLIFFPLSSIIFFYYATDMRTILSWEWWRHNPITIRQFTLALALSRWICVMLRRSSYFLGKLSIFYGLHESNPFIKNSTVYYVVPVCRLISVWHTIITIYHVFVLVRFCLRQLSPSHIVGCASEKGIEEANYSEKPWMAYYYLFNATSISRSLSLRGCSR